MKPGDTIERSAWVTGEETPAQMQNYKARIQEAVDELCVYHNVIAGPVKWTTLKPGDERVPPVPDHIQGWDVSLLVAHADVLRYRQVAHSFLAELEPKDLKTLRQITRRIWMKQRGRHIKAEGGNPVLSNEDCDSIIEAMGPEAAMDAVRGMH